MKKTSLKALFGAGASALALMSAPAFAADLDVEPEKEYVEVGSFRGSILLPGTGISFKVGGYTKADFIFTFDDFDDGGIFNELATGVALFAGAGGADGDRVAFHARQSRINFDARTTTDLGSARAFLEWDLFNGGGSEVATNSANPRLRHAFAEIGIDSLGGSLLAGQTWTNFGDLGSYANTLDFNGPNAQVFVRQAQLRWTQPISDAFTFSIAAENPELLGGATLGGPGGDGIDAVPDFTLALKHASDIGNFHLGAVLRYLDQNEGGAAANGVAAANITNDTAFGYGVQFAGTINVGEKDKFRFQVNWGEGIGRYVQIVAFSGAVPEVAIDGAGNINTIGVFGTIASYQHFWSDKLQSNLVGGFATTESAAGEAAVNQEYYAVLNLIYSPRSNINIGIEGQYLQTDFTNAAGVNFEGDGFRLQTSVQFSF